MVWELIWGLVLTILPITELRIGLPVVINYCLKNNLSIFPFFMLVIALNCLVVFFIFFFLENIHNYLLNWRTYKKFFNKFLEKTRKRQEKFEKKFHDLEYLALVLFVAVPLPGTGAWTGTFLAWFFGLRKEKAIPAILLGVISAGILILLASLGILNLLYR
jgi:uncharacterized membrane protein